MSILKSLHQRGQHNWIKILCLATGLATGIVLIGKAGFEQSWDNFFPTSDRIYVVYEDIIRNGEYIYTTHRRLELWRLG
jgi:putative ABC transport system permease protein